MFPERGSVMMVVTRRSDSQPQATFAASNSDDAEKVMALSWSSMSIVAEELAEFRYN